MAVSKDQLKERLEKLISDAVYEVLLENDFKEAIKQSVRTAIIQRISIEAEKRAHSLVGELLGSN